MFEYVSKGLHLKGSIFFPLKVAPMRIENNINGHSIEKPPKLNYANLSYNVKSGSEITPCNKINKPLVVYQFMVNVIQ